MYVHRRVAVQPTLPLGSERTDHTATRPSAYRFGTLDAIWQCETHCHSGPSVQYRVGGTAMHVHRRVAVQLTLPLGSERTDHTATRPSAYRFGTLDAIWQCETHCHSGLSVPPSYVHQ